MLEPLQKLVRLSPPIAESLACREIFNRTVQKLGHKDAVTRLNLLRILRTICDATEEGCTLIKTYHVYDTIIHLSNHDSAILVRQMAEELVHACDEVAKRSTSRASGFRRPASSSGARAGSGSSNGSTIISGMTPPTPTSLKNTFSMPPIPPTPSLSSRDRITRSQSAVGIWDLPEETTKPSPLIRATTTIGSLGVSSTGSPSLSNSSSRLIGSRPPSRDSSSLSRNDNGRIDSSVKSRLPKARQGRLSEVASRRRERDSGIGSSMVGGEENQTPQSNISGRSDPAPPAAASAPLPRLQIARRRRETSGGEMGFVRRGSRTNNE